MSYLATSLTVFCILFAQIRQSIRNVVEESGLSHASQYPEEGYRAFAHLDVLPTAVEKLFLVSQELPLNH